MVAPDNVPEWVAIGLHPVKLPSRSRSGVARSTGPCLAQSGGCVCVEEMERMIAGVWSAPGLFVPGVC